MASNDTQGLLLNHILGLMLKKIVVPADFHGRVRAVREMQDDDVSGLVDSLTDFAVQTATVDFNIETDNNELSMILKTWLDTINRDLRGKIPVGIKPLAQEYFKERWKYSSFPILRISKWDVDPKSKLMLPSRMFFLDGGSVHAQDRNPEDALLSVDQYDYFIGKVDAKTKLEKNVIFSRQNGRWFDKYPNPYLVKRGIYHNWRIIEAIKRNEIDVLDQVIPYLFWIKKGTERLAIDKKVNYDDKKLQKVIDQMEKLINDSKNSNLDLDKKFSTPVRASQFDEELKHLIPDLEAIFKPALFQVAEKNILSGLGFIDVVDGSTSTRRESILNPKPFIQEVHSGVEDFKQIMKDLLLLIIEKNSDHRKYMNAKFDITSSPIRGFMTDEFKKLIRSMWDRGQVSSKTAVELVGELDFEVEVERREKEAKDGTDFVMYPHLTQNKEGTAFDVHSGDEGDSEDPDNLPDDKTDPIEKKNFDKASLVNKFEDEMELIGSPFSSVKDLPKNVKDKLPALKDRRKWLEVFNGAFNYYKGKGVGNKRAESLAFATAWSKVKK